MKFATVLLALALQTFAVCGESSVDGFPWPSLQNVTDAFCSLCRIESSENVLCKLCPVPPPGKTTTVYNLIEPKYTGVANKDAGDFVGDALFIFSTFSPQEAGNPEASIENNVLEMTTVTVEDWSTEYLPCNAPGATYKGPMGILNCPSTNADYCCVGNRTEVTANTLPAYNSNSSLRLAGGYWFSFPKESEGKRWTQKLERRIKGSCVGNEWRKDAGGCPSCGEHLDQCVALCIQKALDAGSFVKDYTKLRPAWDRAFMNKTLCPDQALPGASSVIVV